MGISIRRACKTLTFDTSTYHYKSRRTGQATLERRIREICETRIRYGYRRVHVLFRVEGWIVKMKKTGRIYNARMLSDRTMFGRWILSMTSLQRATRCAS